MINPYLPLLITTGDPAGIGMDITAQLLASGNPSTRPIIITACQTAWQTRMATLQQKGVAVIGDLPIIDLKEIANLTSGIYLLNIPCQVAVTAGTPNPANAKMVQTQLDIAHELAITGQVGAIVTAPLAKSVLIDGGVSLPNSEKFSGHTEYFMAKCGLDKVVMMLANQSTKSGVMRVALVTTHIPLKEVSTAITKQAVADTVRITYNELQSKFGIASPRILVCGLNPHAGENGHLGDEEIDTINPVLQDFQAQGYNVSLAMPADTLFTPKHLATCDAVIAMYHDQGLAPLKSHGFGQTVNITLGLPYIRTSVDHGTAFDLAGTGQADFGSLWQAVKLADEMANRQMPSA